MRHRPAPAKPVATPTPASLAMDATGLGPCTEPWYMTCNYGIRVEGAGGYDHRGNFAWEGRPPAGKVEPGRAASVASTGISGDVPATLAPGVWTISFRLWYGSDAISFEPVPGGTPPHRGGGSIHRRLLDASRDVGCGERRAPRRLPGECLHDRDTDRRASLNECLGVGDPRGFRALMMAPHQVILAGTCGRCCRLP